MLEHDTERAYRVVGIYRDEETLEPVPYFQKLVSNIDERMALVWLTDAGNWRFDDRNYRPAEKAAARALGAGAGGGAGRHCRAGESAS